MSDDYQDLRDWMHRPDVQAAVARQSESEEEEPPEPEQLAMSLDAPAQGREGA